MKNKPKVSSGMIKKYGMINENSPKLTKSKINNKNYKTIWDKVFKNGPSKFCGRQPLKTLKQTIPLQIFLRLSSTNFTWSFLEYFVPFVL